jgi:hypothetical protein
LFFNFEGLFVSSRVGLAGIFGVWIFAPSNHTITERELTFVALIAGVFVLAVVFVVEVVIFVLVVLVVGVGVRRPQIRHL